ncbi:MAG: tRNA modification GTPase [Thalassobius sp.]|nr:tRNA modification GTPase [Thalassovita sp.]
MKKVLLTITITLLTTLAFAQVKFEKGYFIDNNNQRTDCLIKNLGWKNNPTSFEYKALKDSSSTNTQTANIETVKEFAVEGAFRYSRFTVQMDKSSFAISELGKDREPVFEEATLFLKLLVGGKANLYVYENGKLTRFFYQTASGKVNQLVYKLYKTESGEISKNIYYQQELWNEVKCETMSMSDAERVRYLQNDLIKYFIKYNECENADLIQFQKGKSKMPFSLSLRPGVTFANTTMESVSDNEIDFGSKTNLRIGLEAEFVLPYNKNKWAIVIEPTYQSFESEGMLLTQNVSFKYHSIDFPLKLRYYSFLNNNSKIYLNAGVLTSLLFNSEIAFGNNDIRALDNDLSLTIGAGYSFKDRLNLEFILNGSRDFTRDNLNWETKYNSFSIVLGYKLFTNAKN